MGTRGFSLSFLEDFGLGGPALAIGAPGASSSSGSLLLEGDEAVLVATWMMLTWSLRYARLIFG